MEDISKSLLNAIGIIANKTAEDVSSDKTVKAIIKKCVNLNTGQYLITYNDRDLNAYTQAGNTEVYSIGDEVYVLVPSGDISERKIILSKTITEEKEMTSDTVCLLNNYNLLGNNIIEQKLYKPKNQLYNKKLFPKTLSANKKADYYYCYLYDQNLLTNEGINLENFDNIEYPVLDINEESFINYAKQAEALLLKAKFKANINSSTVGNYGIIINIAFNDTTNPVVDEDGNVVLDSTGNTLYNEREVAYVLDNSSMTGNPMKYYDYSPQYTINNFDGANYIRINSIVIFSENFSVTETDSNIYIDELEIFALDEIAATDGDYQMQITTPKGNTVKSGESGSLQIDAKMAYKNEDISRYSNFYWAVKDPTITSASENYNAKVGTGYRYLDNINKTTNSITISSSDLSAKENVYKCVGIYNDDIILKSDISLYNNNNNLDIAIISDKGTQFQLNEGSPTLTCTINGKTEKYINKYDDSAFTFVWSKIDEENGNVLLNQTVSELEAAKKQELLECSDSEDGMSSNNRTAIQVLSYYSTRITQAQNVSFPFGTTGPQIQCTLKNVTAYVTYSCSVYCSGNYIGYAEITLQNSSKIENNNYYISIVNGNQVFQYNESGVSPASGRNTDPIEVLSLSVNFYNPQGEQITPKQVQWVVPTENTLIDIPSLNISTDSATQEKRFTGFTFPLSIKESYDITATNNQLTAIVFYNDGTTDHEYRKTTNLLFTKIGDIGTNGTDTVLKINELIDSSDDCLTIIKAFDGSGTWNVYQNESAGIRYPCSSTPVLDVGLYTNNTLNSGYSVTWSAAGSSKNYSKNYSFNSSNEDNSCKISYNFSSEDNRELDIRIAEAEVRYNNQHYYSYYSIPTIEYLSDSYSYSTHPIKIKKNGTLKTVLYNSDGTNPSYDKTKGVLLDTGSWNPFIKWHVEGGPCSSDGSYNYPNLLLSATSGDDKTGSIELSQEDTDALTIENLQTTVDTHIQEAAATSASLSSYIAEFKDTIEKIIVDENTSIISKLEKIKTQLSNFRNGTKYSSSVYVVNVYCLYNNIYEKIKKEVDAIVDYNTECLNINEKISKIWAYTWPSIINDSDTHCDLSLEEIWQKYNNNEKISYDSEFRKNEIEKAEESFSNIEIEDNTREAAAVMYCYFKELVDATNTVLNSNQLSNEDEIALKEKYASCLNSLKLADFVRYADKSANILELKQAVGDIAIYLRQIFLAVPLQKKSVESKTFITYQKAINGENIEVLNKVYVIPNDSFNGLYTNNNIVAELYDVSDLSDPVIKVYVPIIMTLNTYELSSLNGWDGVSLEVNEDEGYILAPQIGAGVKNSKTNAFTGIVMGSATNPSSNGYGKDKVGIMGYSEGRQSIFLDANTGKAVFGLAADDNEYDEGRIELVPGGVSKIGGWKIGNRFLYNIPGGTHVNRTDNDARSDKLSKRMIPHDKYGIILSADQPYIHIKGKVYEDDYLSGIDYTDEYNSISPRDSLELRLDPDNKSLFSIVQHTAGPGDELPDDVYVGYTLGKDDYILKDYINNQNIEDEKDEECYYYIYYLLKDDNDKAKYKSYYTTKNIKDEVEESTEDETKENTEDETKIEFLNFNLEELSLAVEDFSIDSNSGTIEVKDDSKNKNDWKYIEGSNFIWKHKRSAIEVGSQEVEVELSLFEFGNNLVSLNSIKRIVLSRNKNFSLDFSSSISAVDDFTICFYITFDANTDNTDVNTDNIDANTHSEILYKSDQFPLTTNFEKIILDQYQQIQFTEKDTGELKLKARLCKGTDFNDLASFSFVPTTTATVSTEQENSEEIAGGYSESKVKLSKNEEGVFINGTCNVKIDGKQTEFNIQITLDNEMSVKTTSGSTESEYDYCLYGFDQNNQINIYGCGVTDAKKTYLTWEKNSSGQWVFTGNKELTEDKTFKLFDSPQNGNGSLFLRFYPLGTFSTMNETSEININGEWVKQTIHNYSSTLNLENYRKEKEYVINKESSISNLLKTKKTQYKITKVTPTKDIPSITIKRNNLTSASITLYTLPENNNNIFCANSSSVLSGIQAKPLALTKKDGNDWFVTFKKENYEEYYKNSNHSSETQTYYVNIFSDDNDDKKTYYKHVKTLTRKSLEHFQEEPINILSSDLEDALNWKEFLRVGIDENGRFFTNGAANKKTYAHSGKIYALGKIQKAYGQEIRTQLSGNNMISILKTFVITSDLDKAKTTYITAGKTEENNISIRTSNKGYVELAAMENYENKLGEVPEVTNFIRVSHDNGIKLKARTSILTIDDTKLEASFGNKVQQQFNYFNSGYSGIKSPCLVFSNDLGSDKDKEDNTWNAKDAFMFKASSFKNNNYRIKASEEEISLQLSSSIIKLTKDSLLFQQSNKTTIELANNKLHFNCNGNSLKIDSDDSDSKNNKIVLQHSKNSYVELGDNQIILSCNAGSSITMTKGITFNCGIDGINRFMNTTQFDTTVYNQGDIRIGCSAGGDHKYARLYLYNYDDNNGKEQWTLLDEEKLHEIYRRVSGRMCWYDDDGNALYFHQDQAYFLDYTSHDPWKG